MLTFGLASGRPCVARQLESWLLTSSSRALVTAMSYQTATREIPRNKGGVGGALWFGLGLVVKEFVGGKQALKTRNKQAYTARMG